MSEDANRDNIDDVLRKIAEAKALEIEGHERIAKRMREIQKEEQEAFFQQQALLVMGVLGSISFAAIVFILQDPSKLEIGISWYSTEIIDPRSYLHAVLLLLATNSRLSIIGSITAAEVSTARGHNKSGARFARFCLNAGLVTFIISLGLLLLPSFGFSLFGGYLLIAGALMYMSGGVSDPRKEASPSNQEGKR